MATTHLPAMPGPHDPALRAAVIARLEGMIWQPPPGAGDLDRVDAVQTLGEFRDPAAQAALLRILHQGAQAIQPPDLGRLLRDTALDTLLRSPAQRTPETVAAISHYYSLWARLRQGHLQRNVVYDDVPVLLRQGWGAVFFRAYVLPLIGLLLLLGVLAEALFLASGAEAGRWALLPAPANATPAPVAQAPASPTPASVAFLATATNFPAPDTQAPASPTPASVAFLATATNPPAAGGLPAPQPTQPAAEATQPPAPNPVTPVRPPGPPGSTATELATPPTVETKIPTPVPPPPGLTTTPPGGSVATATPSGGIRDIPTTLPSPGIEITLTPESTVTAVATVTSTQVIRTGEYPEATQVSIFPGNYEKGRRGQPIEAIVNHLAQANLPGMRSWFNNPGAMSSVNYAVGTDGHIEQYVNDLDTAFANGTLRNPNYNLAPWLRDIKAGTANNLSISIEWEGFQGSGGNWWRPGEGQYQGGLALINYLANQYGVAVDRQHIGLESDLDSVRNADNPGPGFPWQRILTDLGHPPPVTNTPIPATETPGETPTSTAEPARTATIPQPTGTPSEPTPTISPTAVSPTSIPATATTQAPPPSNTPGLGSPTATPAAGQPKQGQTATPESSPVPHGLPAP